MRTFMILLCALAACALNAGTLRDALDRAAAVAAGDSEAYVALRAEILAMGHDALPGLREAAAQEHWTLEGWPRALAAEACRLRLERPELAEIVDHPPSLKPERYRQFRKPMPLPQRDLSRLEREAVPLMLERLRWTLHSYPYSDGDAGEQERQAYALALLACAGLREDARARWLLQGVLSDSLADVELRAQAAVSLAQCAGSGALPLLTATFDDALQPLGVREACGWALGRVPGHDALDALKLRLQDPALKASEHGAALARALITGVGLLGTEGAWKARGPMFEAAGHSVREGCARLLVDALAVYPAEVEAVERALTVTALPASADWLQTLSQDAARPEAVRNAALQVESPLRESLKLSASRR
jgi:hypothetical protein